MPSNNLLSFLSRTNDIPIHRDLVLHEHPEVNIYQKLAVATAGVVLTSSILEVIPAQAASFGSTVLMVLSRAY